jgi:ankyrin repeat protein
MVSCNNRTDAKNHTDYGPSIAIVDKELTKWFLAHGANPNEGCMLDVTPLSYAVEFATFEVIKLLFNQGGSIERGQLLHFAAYRKSADQAGVLAYLVEKGFNVNHIMYQNRMDNYNMQKDWSLSTPLHRAAERGQLIGAKWLVEQGGNPRIRDSLGQLPLDRAEAWSRSDVAEYLRPITEVASEPDVQ